MGLVTATGKRAEFTWAAAERGVLVTGSDATQIARPALAVVCAAIRRRKPVIVIELGPGGRSPGLRDQAVAAGHRLGVPVTELSAGCRNYGGVLGRAIRDRAVVVAGAGSRAGDTGSRADGTAAGAGGSGDPSAGVTGSCPGAAGRSAVTVLAAILAGLRDLGLRADCLAVVSGCEELEPGAAADLLTAAREAGTAVLLLTTSAHAAGGLVPPAGTTIVCGRLPGIWLHQFAGADAAGMCAPGAEALGPDRDWRGRQRDALRDLARGDLAIMAGGSAPGRPLPVFCHRPGDQVTAGLHPACGESGEPAAEGQRVHRPRGRFRDDRLYMGWQCLLAEPDPGPAPPGQAVAEPDTVRRVWISAQRREHRRWNRPPRRPPSRGWQPWRR